MPKGSSDVPETFKAILISRDEDKRQSVTITELTEADLMEGDVTVAVEATTVNYKDGLAITGKAPVVRRFPLIPGVDFAGTVTASSHAAWQPGDQVALSYRRDVEHGAIAPDQHRSPSELIELYVRCDEVARACALY